MTRARLALVAAIAVGAALWWYAGDPAERAIRGRLQTLAEEFNESTTDGLGTVARAARLGSYFTNDVVIELGQGSPPIQGRETLIGMAARLQPRTAAFELELDDVGVEMVDDAHANVTLTIMIRRRNVSSGEESLDAREFSAEMRHADGDWRLARVVAIDTLR
jgi:hypothetical protein